MASNAPGACCAAVNFHEGTPIGIYETIYGLNTYKVGSGDNIIVIATDIYGNTLNNVLLNADELSRGGFTVLIPDILNNDPLKEGAPIQDWLPNHGSEITAPIFDGFLQKLRATSPKFVAGIGYCFGAKYIVQNLAKGGLLDVGAIAHPSFVTIEEVKAITKPVIISAAETDPIFTTELRHQTEAVLAENKTRYQIDLYSGVSHGFAVRGDLSDPVFKYAKERALISQLSFFNHVAK